MAIPKVFKLKKDKEVDNQYILRSKNLTKKQVKELRADIDAFCKAYFEDFCIQKTNGKQAVEHQTARKTH